MKMIFGWLRALPVVWASAESKRNKSAQTIADAGFIGEMTLGRKTAARVRRSPSGRRAFVATSSCSNLCGSISEVVFQTELNPPWLVRRIDGCSVRRPQAGYRLAEVWRVGKVKGLESELQVVSFPGHVEALGQDEVEVA